MSVIATKRQLYISLYFNYLQILQKFYLKKSSKYLVIAKKDINFALANGEILQCRNDSVAQLVEQMTLNHWVVGSSPTGVTIKNGKTPQSTEIT